MHVLDVDSGINCILGVLRTYVNERVLVVADGGGVLNLVETHHVRDDLLVDVGLAIALDQVGQYRDCASGLVAEDLACRNVIGRDNVGGFVLLGFAKLGNCVLELAIKDVQKGRVEAHQRSNRCRHFAVAVLIGHRSQHAI